MKLVYIAGPYRGETPWEVEQNIQKAERWAHAVAGLGAFPVCPHTNVRPHTGCCQPSEFWLEGDKELLKRACDAVFLCPGWENSVGSVGERDHAEEWGIPRFKHLGNLEIWLRDQEDGS